MPATEPVGGDAVDGENANIGRPMSVPRMHAGTAAIAITPLRRLPTFF